jgi:hypothetical protein
MGIKNIQRVVNIMVPAGMEEEMVVVEAAVMEDVEVVMEEVEGVVANKIY